MKCTDFQSIEQVLGAFLKVLNFGISKIVTKTIQLKLSPLSFRNVLKFKLRSLNNLFEINSLVYNFAQHVVAFIFLIQFKHFQIFLLLITIYSF